MSSTARYVRQDGDMWLGYFDQFPDLHSVEIPAIRSVAELAVE